MYHICIICGRVFDGSFQIAGVFRLSGQHIVVIGLLPVDVGDGLVDAPELYNTMAIGWGTIWGVPKRGRQILEVFLRENRKTRLRL